MLATSLPYLLARKFTVLVESFLLLRVLLYGAAQTVSGSLSCTKHTHLFPCSDWAASRLFTQVATASRSLWRYTVPIQIGEVRSPFSLPAGRDPSTCTILVEDDPMKHTSWIVRRFGNILFSSFDPNRDRLRGYGVPLSYGPWRRELHSTVSFITTTILSHLF